VHDRRSGVGKQLHGFSVELFIASINRWLPIELPLYFALSDDDRSPSLV